IAFSVWFFGRRRRESTGRLDELRTAASNTLSLADNAVNEIESSGASLSPDVRAAYDRALALREGARTELERGATPAALTQANQDAAQAVLALQGVMRTSGIQSRLSNPLDLPTEHRCFYCGRTDRPPYVTRTIEDGKGNSMEIEVCSADMAELERGRTPQIQTAQYGGGNVPWWAVPNSPWYYSYGGPSWQYWLPFLIGVDVGGWFGSGWGGPGDGWGQDYNAVSPDAGYAGGEAYPQGAQDPGDFSGWGDQGSGVDSGGGDWGGGDSGGGDWGGGDSGGW
ncbi:MAG TPA: hypothetical protein VF221_10835, partial [Chloroflexota bacterium]